MIFPETWGFYAPMLRCAMMDVAKENIAGENPENALSARILCLFLKHNSERRIQLKGLGAGLAVKPEYVRAISWHIPVGVDDRPLRQHTRITKRHR